MEEAGEVPSHTVHGDSTPQRPPFGRERCEVGGLHDQACMSQGKREVGPDICEALFRDVRLLGVETFQPASQPSRVDGDLGGLFLDEPCEGPQRGQHVPPFLGDQLLVLLNFAS